MSQSLNQIDVNLIEINNPEAIQNASRQHVMKEDQIQQNMKKNKNMFNNLMWVIQKHFNKNILSNTFNILNRHMKTQRNKQLIYAAVYKSKKASQQPSNFFKTKQDIKLQFLTKQKQQQFALFQDDASTIINKSDKNPHEKHQQTMMDLQNLLQLNPNKIYKKNKTSVIMPEYSPILKQKRSRTDRSIDKSIQQFSTQMKQVHQYVQSNIMNQTVRKIKNVKQFQQKQRTTQRKQIYVVNNMKNGHSHKKRNHGQKQRKLKINYIEIPLQYKQQKQAKILQISTQLNKSKSKRLSVLLNTIKLTKYEQKNSKKCENINENSKKCKPYSQNSQNQLQMEGCKFCQRLRKSTEMIRHFSRSSFIE